MSTLLSKGTITGKGSDQDTDSVYFLQSAVLERSLPEARRLRDLYEAKDGYDGAVKTSRKISITIIQKGEAQKLSTARSSRKTVCMGDLSSWNRYCRGTYMCCTRKTGGQSRNSWLMRTISTRRPRGRHLGYYIASHL
jgi:hypothetical protein